MLASVSLRPKNSTSNNLHIRAGRSLTRLASSSHVGRCDNEIAVIREGKGRLLSLGWVDVRQHKTFT